MTTTERRPIFPPMIALVNPIPPSAFAMRFEREEIIPQKHLEKDVLEKASCVLKGDVPRQLVHRSCISVFVTDAVFIFKPFVRITGGAGSVEGRIKFVIEDREVIDSPILDLLVSHLHDPKLEEPVAWSSLEAMFYGSPLPLPGVKVEGDKKLGPFLPNGSVIEASVYDFKTSEEVRLEAGLLGALYTTKDLPEEYRGRWKDEPEEDCPPPTGPDGKRAMPDDRRAW